ncbi:MAG: hypothetical protein AB7S70_08360 [Hyphomicrobium sp.]|uniref:hypothetical protein n=1 Tax=Hyphomicrobium sp. TaxID=82 RepID=UPI003D13E43A
MRARSLTASALIAAIAAASAPAAAGPSTSRQAAGGPPLKDCTRMNGRVGYYANPWCSPAEQARWDRWDARRFLKR